MPDTRQRESDLADEVAALRAELATLNNHRFVRVQNNLFRLFLYRFALGLFTGFGTVVGATVLVSLAIYWLQGIEWVPLIGDWAADIASQMQRELQQIETSPRDAVPEPEPPGE